MTISQSVYNQLFEPTAAGDTTQQEAVIRLYPTQAKAGVVVNMSANKRIQMWTEEEHERFLEALEMYPSGPWKKVSEHVGTKTPRQTMTHAQKYRQKIHRRQRGLRNQKHLAVVTKEKESCLRVATTHSPSGVADLCEQTSSQIGFNLLNILAYSAAVAESNGVEIGTSSSQPSVHPYYPQQLHTIPSPGPSIPSSVPHQRPRSLPPLSQILQLGKSTI